MSKAKTTAPKGAATYEIGHGKPPLHTRFKPGQSGNPGGRKKGARNLKTVIADILETEIELIENGRARKRPLIDALILKLVQEALSGDTRAIRDLLDRYERVTAASEERADEPLREDEAIIRRALNRETDAAGLESGNAEAARATDADNATSCSYDEKQECEHEAEDEAAFGVPLTAPESDHE